MQNTQQDKIDQLTRSIIELEAQLVDLCARLPAHSIPPSMIVLLDELDARLEQAQRELQTLLS